MKPYEDKFVIFADILGWRELVKQSEEDESILKQLQRVTKLLTEIDRFTPDAVDAINTVSSQKSNAAIELGKADVGTIQFSDSLVFVFSHSMVSFIYAYAVLSAITSILANVGFFIRGGIDYGSIHYEDRAIFGPALNRAYYIESECAKVPRILFSDRAQQALSTMALPAEFLFLDEEQLCLNTFRHLENVDKIKTIVQDKIRLYGGEPNYLVKYHWLEKRLEHLSSSSIESDGPPL